MIILIGLMTLIGAVTLVRLLVLRRRFRFRSAGRITNNNDLPTVSVCIPARNEMHVMTECLERLLASDYQRLEIIVLDDSSVDNTSMLIKSFAHAGVRFVEGSPLPTGWLGKNHALQGLLEEASGQYILFLDVDTILKPFSIRELVESTTTKGLSFLSVVPLREDGLRASVFLGTLRYFWTLLFGGKNHPAASSAAWLVDRKLLLATGGFTSYKNMARPEVYIAANMQQATGSQLVISSSVLGISYEKKWSSQIETSIRLLTPMCGGSIPATLLGILLGAMIIVPIYCFIDGLIADITGLVAACIMYAFVMTCLSLVYFKTVWKHGWWLGALHWPYVVLQEAVLMAVSGYKYARKSVTWKGRPIQVTQSIIISGPEE